MEPVHNDYEDSPYKAIVPQVNALSNGQESNLVSHDVLSENLHFPDKSREVT